MKTHKKLLKLCGAGKIGAVRGLLEAAGLESSGLASQVRDDGETALHRAAAGGHVDIMQLLAEHGGADTMSRRDAAKTPLHEAATFGHVDAVVWLLARDALLDCHKTNGWTPLLCAAKGGHANVVTELCERGANVDGRNREGATALYVASREGHTEVVRRLLGAGADPNGATENRRSPLHAATMNGHVAALRALVAGGASIEACLDSSGTSLWHEAAMAGRVEVLECLLDLSEGPAPNAAGGRLPMHCAAVNAHVSYVEALLDRGLASVDDVDDSGGTALYLACAKGHVDVVRVLLARGADANRSSCRRSPLHLAAGWGRLGCVELLLAHGADVEAVDMDGNTPHDLALAKAKEREASRTQWEGVGDLEGAAGSGGSFREIVKRLSLCSRRGAG